MPPRATDGSAGIGNAPSEGDEAAGLDPREWICSLTEGDEREEARGHGTSRTSNQNFNDKLSSPQLIRTDNGIIEIPKGAEVTVFRSLGKNRASWPKRSNRTLALIAVRNVPGHLDYQLTVYMDGHIVTRRL